MKCNNIYRYRWIVSEVYIIYASNIKVKPLPQPHLAKIVGWVEADEWLIINSALTQDTHCLPSITAHNFLSLRLLSSFPPHIRQNE